MRLMNKQEGNLQTFLMTTSESQNSSGTNAYKVSVFLTFLLQDHSLFAICSRLNFLKEDKYNEYEAK